MYLSDGKRLLVTAESEKALLVVDVPTGKVVEAIDTGQHVSHMVVMSPDEQRAFVANIGSGSATVIDLQSAKQIAIIPTGEGAEAIDISPDGGEVWVGNRAADTLTIIDAKSLKVVDTVKSASFPIRLKFTPNGKHVLVSNARSGEVAVFDATTRKEVRRIAMKAAAVEGSEGRLFKDTFGDSPVPVGILITPDGRRAYVANTNADVVIVIDLSTWKIVDRLKAGREPDGLGYSAHAGG